MYKKVASPHLPLERCVKMVSRLAIAKFFPQFFFFICSYPQELTKKSEISKEKKSTGVKLCALFGDNASVFGSVFSSFSLPFDLIES